MKINPTIRKILHPKTASILFWIWLITIFTLSSIPKIPTAKLETAFFEMRLDYMLNFGVYALLSVLFYFWKSTVKGHINKKHLLIYLTAACFFAALEETHQLWIDGRTFNPLDMLSNFLGVFAGIFIWRIKGLKPE